MSRDTFILFIYFDDGIQEILDFAKCENGRTHEYNHNLILFPHYQFNGGTGLIFSTSV